MLKWTVMTRRDAPPSKTSPRTPASVGKAKRRRSSAASRRSSVRRRASVDALDAGKENQFTSTPIKAAENFLGFEALRDVSNLTPNVKDKIAYLDNQRFPSAKKCKSEKKLLHTPDSSPRLHHKKKKDCLSFHSTDLIAIDTQTSNYFRPFETVDSHIEGVDLCSCQKSTLSCVKKRVPDTYAPTLPTFTSEYSPCQTRTTHCLETLNRNSSKKLLPITKLLQDENTSSKKAKVDHVSDFLHQITFLTSPEANDFTRFKLDLQKLPSSSKLHQNVNAPPNKKPKVDHVSDLLHQITFLTSPEANGFTRLKSDLQKLPSTKTVTPLVKKFLDFKFNKTKCKLNNNHNDSSFINNMSLDKIVDAILDSSDESIRPTVRKALNTTLIVNEESEDNVCNESQEDNLLNLQQEQKKLLVDVSLDSGFRSCATENSHKIDDDFLCKCTKATAEEKTMIQLNETFNERCVDWNRSLRKRHSTEADFETQVKKLLLDTSQDDSDFTLKRQKCVRRRRPISVDKRSCTFDSKKIDFESTPIQNCYLENKVIPGETFVVEAANEARRCLVFDSSSKISEASSFSESASTSKSSLVDVRGSMDLKMYAEDKTIFVNVIKCKDLYRPSGEKINAYVKVALTDRLSEGSRRKSKAALQRTAVQGDTNRPHFNHTFKFRLNSAEDIQKRLKLEVWHRDRILRTSEFLGCMSFDVKHVIEEATSGTFRLLPQSTGRTTHVHAPITNECRPDSFDEPFRTPPNMYERQCSVDELISLDDPEADPRKPGGRTALGEQQKHADENLFLRYLELDPTEGPDANSAATQRKATGNKNGRTPFTCTKRLTRPPKTGFGFSVVWTHPPRIERVEKGLPADRAGILPGDYVIFVDKHNVVMMPEIDILNLIRSYGSQLTLEIFRRNPSRNGSLPSIKRPSTHQSLGGTLMGSSILPVTSCTNLPQATPPNFLAHGATPSLLPMSSCTNLPQRRPSTVCSTNTTSMECGRRRLNLPQVTFSSEKQTNNPEENRRKAMYQLISKEQQYATGLQFAITRFVSALAERKDLITASEHRILFQNCEEILRITEDILDHLIQDDGEPQIHHLTKIYHTKMHDITTAYKRYCSGIQKADCILAGKTKNSNSDFVRFLQVPQIPKRRPDITSFIHKPLEHYREVLRLLTAIQSNTKPGHDEFPVINQIIHDLQLTYREITSESGLMEPLGEGRPLLTVQDLENRLVFTKCKPFVLNKPGRQWIFGGDLSRIEGRNVRQYWTLLFSDLLLFAKASRDRVLFVTEDPLPLAHVQDVFFNVRKKDTEFRITVNPEGKDAKSPTVHCGPDLSRTPRKNANKKTVILRAPNPEMKAVWQNLLQRQIFISNSGIDGSALSSPLDSPDAQATLSAGTLHSAESLSLRRQPQNVTRNCQTGQLQIQKQIDALIDLKCKQLVQTEFHDKYNSLHLEQWMKGELNAETLPASPPELEPLAEEWTEEMVRLRSEELELVDAEGNLKSKGEARRNDAGCDETSLCDLDHSPSKSTTTESQVTVRSSPLVPETVPVCRQCHKNCLSSHGTVNHGVQNIDNCNSNRASNDGLDNTGKDNNQNKSDEWQTFLLLGMMANPSASLVHIDPFSVPPIPQISIVSATPESSVTRNSSSEKRENSCQCQYQNGISYDNHQNNHDDFSRELDKSPDDSPETEEHPYHSLSSSVATLRRYGTMSSLERVGSDEKDDVYENNISDSDEDNDADDEEGGLDNAAFNHSSSIRQWTAKAGCFVAEKMAMFEKLGEDYKTGSFFDRYLRNADQPVNGEDQQEEETSGATSGEEIWGTPTSGDMDDNLNSPSYDDKQSPNDGSISSDYGDETEIMMDELLMTPPITGAIMRGLLPRRTLEPLIEEDDSETSTSSSIDSTTDPSVSPEQGSGTGGAADTCSAGAASPDTGKLRRSESYRRIVEAAESEGSCGFERGDFFFNRLRPAARFATIERVSRSRSIKIFEFFNVRKPERRIYERFPEDRNLFEECEKEEIQLDEFSPLYSKPGSPKILKDKQMDRRFWKQLTRRRGTKGNVEA